MHLAAVVASLLLLSAQPGPQPFVPSFALRVDPARSSLLVVTDVDGALGFFGHRHAILAERPTGEICLRTGRTSGTIQVDARALVIDSPEARRRAGLDEGPDPDTVEDLQQKLLSDRFLAAERHPAIWFSLEEVTQIKPGVLIVGGALTVAGNTEMIDTTVHMQEQPDGAVTARGSFVVEQSAFGIEPESVAGLVRVADPVEIRFELTGVPTGQPCG